MTLYDAQDAFKEMDASKVEGLGTAVVSLFNEGGIPEATGNTITDELFGKLKTFQVGAVFGLIGIAKSVYSASKEKYTDNLRN